MSSFDQVLHLHATSITVNSLLHSIFNNIKHYYCSNKHTVALKGHFFLTWLPLSSTKNVFWNIFFIACKNQAYRELISLKKVDLVPECLCFC